MRAIMLNLHWLELAVSHSNAGLGQEPRARAVALAPPNRSVFVPRSKLPHKRNRSTAGGSSGGDACAGARARPGTVRFGDDPWAGNFRNANTKEAKEVTENC
jgi:hypothetical protein